MPRRRADISGTKYYVLGADFTIFLPYISETTNVQQKVFYT